MRAASLETLLHMTAAGYGVTLAPQMAAAGWRGKGGLVCVPIEGEDVSRRVRLVWRRDMPRRIAMRALADVARKSAPAGLVAV
ncbi:MAG TPA: LysR substrate-binding domain-containing protein [Rhodoblastus sp.]|nr:LysR substrate-binding domain-containing protein [Rhodoblastus sp.]